jgi:hypothetical protein
MANLLFGLPQFCRLLSTSEKYTPISLWVLPDARNAASGAVIPKAGHLMAYLDQMTWRFNNRKNPFLFRDTMLKLIHSENLEYRN